MIDWGWRGYVFFVFFTALACIAVSFAPNLGADMLAISAALVVFGLVTSDGFLMNLLGASIAGLGGAATYLILSHRKDRKGLE